MRLPKCRNCKTREVIPDGYGGFVHEDDWRYMCEPSDPESNTSAAVR